MGHVHHHTYLTLDGRLVVVPGATERMTFGECAETPGFVYLELTPGGPERLEHRAVPSQARYQTTVRAADATSAEAWSKAIIIRGRDGLPRAQANGVEVFLEDAAGVDRTGGFVLEALDASEP